MAKQDKNVDPDSLLDKLKTYIDEGNLEEERNKRSEKYSGDSPTSVDDLMKRLRERGFIESLGDSQDQNDKKTAWSSDEDGEFSEDKFTKEYIEETPPEKEPEPVITIVEKAPENEESEEAEEFSEDEFESTPEKEFTEDYSLDDLYGLEEKEPETASGYVMIPETPSDEPQSEPDGDDIAEEDIGAEEESEEREKIEWSEPYELASEETPYDRKNEPIAEAKIIEEARPEVRTEEKPEIKPEENNQKSESPKITIEEIKKPRIKENNEFIEDENPEKFEPSFIPESKIKEEYTEESDHLKILAKIRRKKTIVKKNLCGLLGISIISFIFEFFIFGGKKIIDFPDRLSALFSLMLVCLCIFFVKDEFMDGVKALYYSRAIPDTYLFFLFIPTVLLYIVEIVSGKAALLLAFPYSVCAIMIKTATLFSLRRNEDQYRLVSSIKKKYVLSKMTFAQKQPEKASYGSYVDDDKYYCVKKTAFCENFFKRSDSVSERNLLLILFIIASFILSVILFAFEYKNESRSAFDAFVIAIGGFYILSPVGVAASQSLLLLRMSAAGKKKGAAVIGESALDECPSGGSVTFSDKDIYSENDIRITGMKLFGKASLDSSLTLAYAIMKKIDSPVAPVLEKAISDDVRMPSVRIKSVYDDGICAEISGVKIYAGSAGFIKEIALVSVPKSVIDKSVSQMFLAVDSRLAALFNIDYSVNKEIAESVSTLVGSGICLAVRSLDPSLTSEFLTNEFGSIVPVKVIKSRDTVGVSLMRKSVDSPIVTKDKMSSMLYALFLCDRGAYSRKMNTVFMISSIVSGFIILTAGVILSVGFPSSFGILISLYHVLWILPTLLTSVFYIK